VIYQYKMCLLIWIFLLISHQVSADISLTKSLTSSIEKFSHWKTKIEYIAGQIKRVAHSNEKELNASRSMYIQVQSTINLLIDRIILDIKSEDSEINYEDYEQSFLRAQTSVKDFTDYAEQVIKPDYLTQKTNLSAITAGLTFIGAVISLAEEVISIKDEKGKKKERDVIVKKLQTLLLRDFHEIEFVDEGCDRSIPNVLCR
jgi:hypothetical protein